MAANAFALNQVQLTPVSMHQQLQQLEHVSCRLQMLRLSVLPEAYAADLQRCHGCFSDQVRARDALKLKEKALEGLGLLFVAHPAALMQGTASATMRHALRITSASCLKLKALSNLLELLKASLGSVLWHCVIKWVVLS